MRPALETGAQLRIVQCRVIFALILVQVCDGGYRENVMKKEDSR